MIGDALREHWDTLERDAVKAMRMIRDKKPESGKNLREVLQNSLRVYGLNYHRCPIHDADQDRGYWLRRRIRGGG